MDIRSIIEYKDDGNSVSSMLKKLSSEENFSGLSFIVILTMIVNVFHDHGFLISEKELKKSIKIIPKEEIVDIKREILLKDFQKILASKKK